MSSIYQNTSIVLVCYLKMSKKISKYIQATRSYINIIYLIIFINLIIIINQFMEEEQDIFTQEIQEIEEQPFNFRRFQIQISRYEVYHSQSIQPYFQLVPILIAYRILYITFKNDLEGYIQIHEDNTALKFRGSRPLKFIDFANDLDYHIRQRQINRENYRVIWDFFYKKTINHHFCKIAQSEIQRHQAIIVKKLLNTVIQQGISSQIITFLSLPNQNQLFSIFEELNKFTQYLKKKIIGINVLAIISYQSEHYFLQKFSKSQISLRNIQTDKISFDTFAQFYKKIRQKHCLQNQQALISKNFACILNQFTFSIYFDVNKQKLQQDQKIDTKRIMKNLNDNWIFRIIGQNEQANLIFNKNELKNLDKIIDKRQYIYYQQFSLYIKERYLVTKEIYQMPFYQLNNQQRRRKFLLFLRVFQNYSNLFQQYYQKIKYKDNFQLLDLFDQIYQKIVNEKQEIFLNQPYQQEIFMKTILKRQSVSIEKYCFVDIQWMIINVLLERIMRIGSNFNSHDVIISIQYKDTFGVYFPTIKQFIFNQRNIQQKNILKNQLQGYLTKRKQKQASGQRLNLNQIIANYMDQESNKDKTIKRNHLTITVYYPQKKYSKDFKELLQQERKLCKDENYSIITQPLVEKINRVVIQKSLKQMTQKNKDQFYQKVCYKSLQNQYMADCHPQIHIFFKELVDSSTINQSLIQQLKKNLQTKSIFGLLLIILTMWLESILYLDSFPLYQQIFLVLIYMVLLYRNQDGIFQFVNSSFLKFSNSQLQFYSRNYVKKMTQIINYKNMKWQNIFIEMVKQKLQNMALNNKSQFFISKLIQEIQINKKQSMKSQLISVIMSDFSKTITKKLINRFYLRSQQLGIRRSVMVLCHYNNVSFGIINQSVDEIRVKFPQLHQILKAKYPNLGEKLSTHKYKFGKKQQRLNQVNNHFFIHFIYFPLNDTNFDLEQQIKLIIVSIDPEIAKSKKKINKIKNISFKIFNHLTEIANPPNITFFNCNQNEDEDYEEVQQQKQIQQTKNVNLLDNLYQFFMKKAPKTPLQKYQQNKSSRIKYIQMINILSKIQVDDLYTPLIQTGQINGQGDVCALFSAFNQILSKYFERLKSFLKIIINEKGQEIFVIFNFYEYNRQKNQIRPVIQTKSVKLYYENHIQFASKNMSIKSLFNFLLKQIIIVFFRQKLFYFGDGFSIQQALSLMFGREYYSLRLDLIIKQNTITHKEIITKLFSFLKNQKLQNQSFCFMNRYLHSYRLINKDQQYDPMIKQKLAIPFEAIEDKNQTIRQKYPLTWTSQNFNKDRVNIIVNFLSIQKKDLRNFAKLFTKYLKEQLKNNFAFDVIYNYMSQLIEKQHYLFGTLTVQKSKTK